MSGTGVKVRGSEKGAMFTAQADLLEIGEVYKAERGKTEGFGSAVVNTVKKPFVWVKENPKETLIGVGVAAAGYFAYEEWIKDDKKSRRKPVAKEGYTQNGKNNKIVIDGKQGLPNDLVQNGEGNVVEFKVSNDVELEEVGAAERIEIRRLENEALANELSFSQPPSAEGAE